MSPAFVGVAVNVAVSGRGRPVAGNSGEKKVEYSGYLAQGKGIRTPPEANPDMLLALGELTVRFNVLETVVSAAIWHLLGVDQRAGQIMTARLSFPRLVDRFCSLIRHRSQDSDGLRGLDELRRQLENAGERRNQLIHSTWAAGDTPSSVRLFKLSASAKSGLKHAFTTVEAADVRRVSNAVAELVNDVTRLVSPPKAPRS